jgi:hypothetical protein
MVRRQELQLDKISRFAEDGESFSNATRDSEEREYVYQLLNTKPPIQTKKNEKALVLFTLSR